MQRIKNIDKIIGEVIKKTIGDITSKKYIDKYPGLNKELNKEFKKDFKENKKTFLRLKEKNQKYKEKWYDNGYSKYKKRQKLYFKKLQTEGGIYYCPYCGKNTITHFENDKGELKKLYDIEHFLPRSLYSSLSINLYNWLPSCMSCNQRLKSNIDPLTRLNKGDIGIFHPYFGFIKKDEPANKDENKIKCEDKTLDERLSFIQNENKNEKKFILTSEHGKKFQLDKIYLHSEDTFQTFDFIYDKYTKIKDEYSRFKENSKSISSFVEYFFKHYYPEKEQDILKYSNGKLKKDLIEDLKKT